LKPNQTNAQPKTALPPAKWNLYLLFFGAMLGLLAGGFFFYSHESKAIRTAKYRELQTITQLKIDQVIQWRKKHINNARILSEDIHLAQSFESWRRHPDENLEKFYLHNHLKSVQQNYDYQRVMLVDAKNEILLSYPDSKPPIDPGSGERIKEAIHSKIVIFGGFFYNQHSDQIHVQLFIPLINAAGKAVAAAVIVIDPDQSFYPLLESWPLPSNSAETLIVRKKGEQALVLNELRHRSDSAMKLTIPITQSMHPTVQAVQGNTGIFEGLDYRGVNVIANIQPVSDSNWLLVAKVDTQEILGQAYYLFREIITLICFSSLTIGLAISLLYYFRQKNIFKNLLISHRQIAEQRKWYQNTFYSLGDGVVTTDTDGHIHHINPAAEALIGWSEKKAFGKPLDQVFHISHEPSRQKVENPVEQVLKLGKMTGANAPSYLVDSSGIEHPIMISGSPINSHNNEIAGVVFSLKNLTDMEQMETSHLTNLSILKQMLDNSPVLIYLVNPKGQILMVNQNMASFLGCPVDQIVYKAVEDFSAYKLMPKRNAPDENIVISKDPQVEEVELEDAAGKQVYLTVRFPIFDAKEKILAVCGVATNLTDHHRSQKQDCLSEKIEAIDRLAGGVAQDFNNMLTVIMEYTKICMNGLLPMDSLYQDLNEILLAARKSKEISEPLLAFTKHQPHIPEIIDIGRIIFDSKAMLERLIGNDIALKIVPDDDLWYVKMDPFQLRQILANLAVNAKEAISGKGSVTIDLANIILDETHCKEHIELECGEFVLLSFSDTGSGMQESIKTRIYDPFFTTKIKNKTKGLGLSTVYGIVKQNRGFILVYSKSGVGSTFKIFLPRAVEEYEETFLEENNEPVSGTETILFVADEIQLLRLFKRGIEALGYNIMTALTPDEAMLRCEKLNAPVDLLVLDMTLPSQKSQELVDRLKSVNSKLKILAMAGFTSQGTVVSDNGPENSYLFSPPFSLDDLALKVRYVLDQ
jgi:two-component system, cell cycle sensor histidine kinase and response regulator CckA